MSVLQNERLVTPVNGCSRITFLAENLTTGISSIFSIKMSVPDQGISYDVGLLSGRVPETQANNNCNGDVIGLTKGNKTYNERSLEVTFGDDYNWIQSIDPKVFRSVALSVFNGGSFKIGKDTYAVIGTNGVRNIGTKSNDNDHQFLFYDEGKVLIPDFVDANGVNQTKVNNFVSAYNENNCIAMEFLYAYNDNNKKGDRFVYTLGGDVTFNEGSSADYNRYSVPAMRYSDYRAIDKYFIDGLPNYQAMATSGTDSIYRVNADIIIEVSGGGVPTVAGTAGQQAVVVDSDDNTVEMYLHDGTDWGTTAPAVTSTLGLGAMIYSQSFDTALDGGTAVNKAGYVSIKTAGTTGNAVAVDAKTNASGSGTATAIWGCYDWVYSGQNFQVYTGVEIN